MIQKIDEFFLAVLLMGLVIFAILFVVTGSFLLYFRSQYFMLIEALLHNTIVHVFVDSDYEESTVVS